MYLVLANRGEEVVVLGVEGVEDDIVNGRAVTLLRNASTALEFLYMYRADIWHCECKP